ncbi:hypothetical protein A7U60_g4825 [Sanghuangporus baumii]|uniref:Uncharacterized protein n=1 Tax=Sanghuangporus baumii TaxID=108892 RepID=A0A9Q5HY77_SANBA|nr:hypothetical protein A7U60_g4825 [Sanghuangporus baumii]
MAEWGVAKAENAQLQETNNPEIPHRPDGIQVDGQTFAATVLFALSCSPLLRAHLLQSLSATSEELDSLEPFLSAAWDQWYQARRIRHTEQVAQARLQEHGVQQQLPTSGQTGGQMFAATLLLALSYSPLLKAHLMRILSITNEELCSFEPVLSAAWDQRDRAVSIVQRLSMFFGDLMAADNTLFVMTPDFVMSNEQVVQARRQEQQPSVDGQTFAATLLLSLSCSPLLKAHLLQGLGATNEELESSEDALSAAWDQWDRARRLHNEQAEVIREMQEQK